MFKNRISISEKQSRSDDILLTVDAIYGQDAGNGLLRKSRTGRYFTALIVPSLYYH